MYGNDEHLGVATLSMTPVQAIKPRPLPNGDFRVELREYLPEGKKFWFGSEVDAIVAKLRTNDFVEKVFCEVNQSSHRGYEVLHVTPRDSSDASFGEKLSTAVRNAVPTTR